MNPGHFVVLVVVSSVFYRGAADVRCRSRGSGIEFGLEVGGCYVL